jgi:CRISPR-associated protein Csm2
MPELFGMAAIIGLLCFVTYINNAISTLDFYNYHYDQRQGILMDIKLGKSGEKLDPELFNTIAHQAAKRIAGDDPRKTDNKSTQLRKFYDEIVLWDSKVARHPEKFDQYLPFIRMINAKAAYAKGRKLVDDNFVELMHKGLQQVVCPETLRTFKLFMEAFMGFYKQERPN